MKAGPAPACKCTGAALAPRGPWPGTSRACREPPHDRTRHDRDVLVGKPSAMCTAPAHAAAPTPRSAGTLRVFRWPATNPPQTTVGRGRTVSTKRSPTHASGRERPLAHQPRAVCVPPAAIAGVRDPPHRREACRRPRQLNAYRKPPNCRQKPTRADARTRTGDPFITSEVLYQLSYVGVCRDFLEFPALLADSVQRRYSKVLLDHCGLQA